MSLHGIDADDSALIVSLGSGSVSKPCSSLPVIPIPLTPPDADVPLDIRSVLDRAYDAANYGKYIYQEAPEPELSPEDDAWAKKCIH